MQRWRIAYVAIFSMVFLLFAFQERGTLFHVTEGKISFRSEAPLELINASSSSLAGLLDTTRRNFSFRVQIRSFEGFNSRTQREHFNENYMQSEKYPEASFKGKIIEEIDLSADGSHEVRAKGILNIHGVEKERIIKAELQVKGRTIRIKSLFTVLLSDHHIPIPRVVHQKLANEIKVQVNTVLQPR